MNKIYTAAIAIFILSLGVYIGYFFQAQIRTFFQPAINKRKSTLPLHSPPPSQRAEQAPKTIAKWSLQTASFQQLRGWKESNVHNSFTAWKKSCQLILARPPEYAIKSNTVTTVSKSWQPSCRAALALHPRTNHDIRRYFQKWFKPWSVHNDHRVTGRFTGYYLYSMPGRKKREPGFHVPIYAMPSNAVMLNPQQFDPAFHHQKWIGKIEQHWLRPYPRLSRYDINRHGLPKARILAWCKHRVDRLFLMIQGSGIIELPHHRRLLLGYDGENCKHNILIGNIMLHRHLIPKNKISLYSIRQWLLKHPHRARQLMNENPAFVFFKRLPGHSPRGANNINLTARTSLAVDPQYVPLNTPIWLSTTLPYHPKQWRHLMISQDTGGAIKGIIRGDVYWGQGEHAKHMASTMDQPGQYWLLLPKSVNPLQHHSNSASRNCGNTTKLFMDIAASITTICHKAITTVRLFDINSAVWHSLT